MGLGHVSATARSTFPPAPHKGAFFMPELHENEFAQSLCIHFTGRYPRGARIPVVLPCNLRRTDAVTDSGTVCLQNHGRGSRSFPVTHSTLQILHIPSKIDFLSFGVSDIPIICSSPPCYTYQPFCVCRADRINPYRIPHRRAPRHHRLMPVDRRRCYNAYHEIRQFRIFEVHRKSDA